QVSVDGKLVVGLGESGAGEREESLRIGEVGLVPVERLLVGGADVSVDVLWQIPTLIFVECGEERDEFAVHCSSTAMGGCSRRRSTVQPSRPRARPSKCSTTAPT